MKHSKHKHFNRKYSCCISRIKEERLYLGLLTYTLRELCWPHSKKWLVWSISYHVHTEQVFLYMKLNVMYDALNKYPYKQMKYTYPHLQRRITQAKLRVDFKIWASSINCNSESPAIYSTFCDWLFWLFVLKILGVLALI
jgi:hypothetical protein